MGYKIAQELFSRKGLDFCEEKPTRRQSSCSCSMMYLTSSSTALLTEMRLTAASLRSCSVTWRCCCKFEITMSITRKFAACLWAWSRTLSTNNQTTTRTFTVVGTTNYSAGFLCGRGSLVVILSIVCWRSRANTRPRFARRRNVYFYELTLACELSPLLYRTLSRACTLTLWSPIGRFRWVACQLPSQQLFTQGIFQITKEWDYLSDVDTLLPPWIFRCVHL